MPFLLPFRHCCFNSCGREVGSGAYQVSLLPVHELEHVHDNDKVGDDADACEILGVEALELGTAGLCESVRMSLGLRVPP